MIIYKICVIAALKTIYICTHVFNLKENVLKQIIMNELLLLFPLHMNLYVLIKLPTFY